MKRAVLVFAIVLATLAATGAYLRKPVTVSIPYITTWHIPVGPAFDAIPSARPADWKPPKQ